jgi:hypothetical protein
MTKPANAGKKRWRPEHNPGVDSRDQRAAEPDPQKPAPGLRTIRGIGRDDHLCHCKGGKTS